MHAPATPTVTAARCGTFLTPPHSPRRRRRHRPTPPISQAQIFFIETTVLGAAEVAFTLLSSREATTTGRAAGALAAAWCAAYIFFLYAVLRRLMFRDDEFQPRYQVTALPPREDEQGRVFVFRRLARLQHGSIL